MNTPSFPPVPRPPSDGLGVASLICGILTLPTCFATFLPAVICGHIAVSRAKASGVPAGKARTGLIFGYGSLAMIPVIAMVSALTAPLVIRQRDKAEQSMMLGNSRALGLGILEYRSDQGSFPASLGDLERQGLVKDLEELLQVPKRHSGEWWYFPQTDGRQSNAVLLVSPPIQTKSAIVRVDGSVQLLPASEAISDGKGEPERIPAPVKSR